MEDWERKANDEHKRVVREFEAGKRGEKSANMENRSVHLRIANHLLETGGGLTASEIEKDVIATKGKEWVDSNDGTPLVISAVLDHMVAPGTHLRKTMESAGGFGLIDFGIASQMDRQNVLVKNGDKYFLWCQDGVDFGAKLETAAKNLGAARKAIEEIDSLEAKVAESEADVASLRSELNGLGMFKFSEKKAVKSKIASAEQSLSELRRSLDGARKAKEAVPSLEAAYEDVCEECRRKYA